MSRPLYIGKNFIGVNTPETIAELLQTLRLTSVIDHTHIYVSGIPVGKYISQKYILRG